MKSTETLRQLEACYEALCPAQEKSADAFIWFSGIHLPFFNAVMHLNSEGSDSERLDRVIQTVPPQLPYSFWVTSESKQWIPYLEKRGFSLMAVCPLMRWQVREVSVPPSDIRLTSGEVVAEINGLDGSIKDDFARLLLASESENYVIVADGKPVGVGTLLPKGYFGGIFNVAILPAYQKKGYGTAMMKYLMKRAYELRMQYVVLLSSPMAEKLYAELGFEKTGEVTVYISPVKD